MSQKEQSKAPPCMYRDWHLSGHISISPRANGATFTTPAQPITGAKDKLPFKPRSFSRVFPLFFYSVARRIDLFRVVMPAFLPSSSSVSPRKDKPKRPCSTSILRRRRSPSPGPERSQLRRATEINPRPTFFYRSWISKQDGWGGREGGSVERFCTGSLETDTGPRTEAIIGVAARKIILPALCLGVRHPQRPLNLDNKGGGPSFLLAGWL